ncbi:MAG TPA: flagellin lysine-N-methylase [Marinospirillum sp.]|uniref:flagellin lysine-N-methylase n=1 Tax=Marinospirillum sp. TaxID=2183934 RepID=UPI002B45AED5|nr:flagellin lysine-N-methylase [Marinospirillum sp.]HKM16042.1 flagellin lysine-N-methylase [Marinospirillum sp.]
MKIDALTPSFASQFQCTKGDCPESCCSNLNVFLDKNTLDLYSSHPALIPLVQEHLIGTDGEVKNQGLVILGKDPATGTCPLLDADDGLCIMRRDFGEDALAQICISYPRIANWLGDDLFITLSESCPEAARLLVESEDAMELGFGAFNLPELMNLPEKPDTVISNDRYHYLQTVLTILKHQEQPLELRLFIIGLYTERADAIINNPEPDAEALPKLTELFFTLIGQGYFEEQAKKMQNQDKHALGLVLLNILREQGVKGSLYEDVRNVLYCLEVNELAPFDEVHLARLNQAELVFLLPLIDKNPAMLENILTNWLLTNLFPLRNPSLTQGWFSIMLRYLLFKTLLSGTGLHQGRLQKSDVTRITYRFSRSINLSNMLQELEINLASRNLNNISSMAHSLRF